MYHKLTEEDIAFFKSISGERVYLSKDVLLEYGHDYTEDLNFPPHIVIKPESTEEVQAVMKYCALKNIPLTPSGARTGLSGGALPVHGGVALSLERMNKVLNIDENNLQVTTEPGVITQVLQESVAEKGLFYPPDPASKGSCFIGGNIAENSGGPKALKYGVTKDYVLNLEVVLTTGEIIWTGANVLKNSTGYNLTQLMVGSEGTLGIVTKIVLKLIPHPKFNQLMLVPFFNAREACEAVAAIFKAGITPSALEFMEREALDYTLRFMGGKSSLNIEDEVQAHLLVEVDGNDENVLFNDCEKIMEVVEHYRIGEVLMASSQAQKDELWQLRRKVGEAVKSESVYKEEDTVVPRYHLPQLLSGVKKIGEKYGFQSVCYGHAGDGNLHVNILRGKMTEDQWNNELNTAIEEIFRLTIELGGTISGEHGIGWVQKNFMHIPFDSTTLNLMRSIKKLFDPQMILNPGKIFPEH